MFAKLPQLLLPGIAVLLTASAAYADAPNGRPASIEGWVNLVNARLDAIEAPAGIEGSASAFIRRADDGRVTLVRIAPASPQLTEATRATLSRIRRLPPMPSGVDPHQLIRVDILFGGENERAYQAQREAMFAAASSANRKLAQHLEGQSIALSRVP